VKNLNSLTIASSGYMFVALGLCIYSFLQLISILVYRYMSFIAFVEMGGTGIVGIICGLLSYTLRKHNRITALALSFLLCIIMPIGTVLGIFTMCSIIFEKLNVKLLSIEQILSRIPITRAII